jgi:hypothetical protein
VCAELIEAMIKTYSLYEAATGLFTGKRLHCDDEGRLSARLPAGTLAMEGAFDHRGQRVDLATGAVWTTGHRLRRAITNGTARINAGRSGRHALLKVGPR